ncbi:cadherin domain protein [Dictyocaulus viviparus]|uniref:Cadherin domain protein n=1 Tax=Dictyocaulus viviparus TaxID=29172 RepID=A0A0D8XQB0_DICVI|nr:cadherin domain protein [Dictyocaulus viviparus]
MREALGGGFKNGWQKRSMGQYKVVSVFETLVDDLPVNKLLDYENVQNLTFTVVATDYGTPQLSSVQEVTVYIIDVNDHAPVLRSTDDVLIVNETAVSGTTLYQFHVDDHDSIENSLSIYQIVDENDGVFDVMPISGQLYLRSSLDFESRTEYNITVTAKNIAGGGTSHAYIMVRVSNSNDETPRFIDGCPITFALYENYPGPYPVVIGSASAEDFDSDENGLITYSITEGNVTVFSTNSETGHLLLLNSLDREYCSEYVLTVQAMDSGATRRSSSCSIKIAVLDDNDNPPVFTQPRYVVHVSENVERGHKLLNIEAVDIDEGENAVIRYSLTGGEPFVIDSETGEVTVDGQIDREQIAEYRLMVKATDSGRYTQLSSVAEVLVIVDDENDNDPVIRNKIFDIFVPDDLNIGDVIYVVDAVDYDKYSTLIFNISGSHSQLFTINENGELFLRALLSLKSFYSIVVGVSDDDGRSTSASFTFYVDNRNAFPRWLSTLNSTSVLENSSGNVFMYVAESSGNNSDVIYSIIKGCRNDLSIDPNSGMLYINGILNREYESSCRLWIAASNSNTPPKFSITSSDIFIVDVNYNSPIFDQVLYEVNITENSDPQQLLCLQASDLDTENNSNISYSIVSGDDMKSFSIDSVSGCIRTTHMLDRETISDYRLMISAVDQGVPSLRSEAFVKIHVLDENDNGPKFSRLFHVHIYEDVEVGTPILFITATDRDDCSSHTFTIENDFNGQFSIDKYSGEIRLQRPLDRETQSSYRFRVTVTDGLWSLHTTVAITVLDINDNKPVFSKKNYLYVVNSTQINRSIGSVVAVDADDDEYGKVYYRLDKDVRWLTIDIISGELRLLATPDEGIFEINVIAQDNGIPVMISSVPVTIIVTPVNIGGSCAIAVERNSSNSAVIRGLMNHCDQINYKETTRLFIPNESSVSIDSEENLIISVDMRENSDIFTAELIAEYENGEIVAYHLDVVFSQENAYPPKFDKDRYNFVISEDITIGDVVGVVDLERNVSGRVHLRIKGTSPFYILQNGSIILNDYVDYEEQNRYTLLVIATDRGQPPRNASVTIVIDILDVDDNPTVIEDDQLAYTITETNNVICPGFFDVDNVNSIARFSTSISKGTIQSLQNRSCIILHDVIPSFIELSTTDGRQNVTTRLTVIDMTPKQPCVCDKTVTIRENGGYGTTVMLYSTDLLVVQTNKSFSIKSANSTVTTSQGISSDQLLVIYTKSKFGRYLKKSQFKIDQSDASPVFPNTTYTVNVPDTVALYSTVVDFQMTLSVRCRLEIVSGNLMKTFCIPKNTSSIIICGHLWKSSYTLIIEVICTDSITSRTEVLIKVKRIKNKNRFPTVGFVREGGPITVITRIPSSLQKNDTVYRIDDERLRTIFSLSSDGSLTSLRPLDQSIRSVYNFNVSIRSSDEWFLHESILVFVDPDFELIKIPSKITVTSMVFNNAFEFDLSNLTIGSLRECRAQNDALLQVTSRCHFIIKQPLNTKGISASIDNITIGINLRSLKYSEDLEQSMLQIVFYATSNGVAEFLTALQEYYDDMTFYPLAVDVVAYHRNTLILTIIDRNQKIITVNDSKQIVEQFIRSSDFTHAIIDSIKIAFCNDTVCANGGECHHTVSFRNNNEIFRGFNSIWYVPRGTIKIRCECKIGYTGELCDARRDSTDYPIDEGCSVTSRCSQSCKKSCTNDECLKNTCECLYGSFELKCSTKDPVDEQGLAIPEHGIITSSNEKLDKLCVDVRCGDGECRIYNGQPICHCSDGLKAVDCSYGSQIISLDGMGYVALTSREHSQFAIHNYTMMNSRDFCDGAQSVSIDFRTMKSYGTIIILSYETEYGIVEIHKSTIRYQMIKSHRILIDMTLAGKYVDDDKWHHVVLELSSNCSQIISLDGMGYVALTSREHSKFAIHNYTMMNSKNFCDGAQSVSIDFRTMKSYGTIIILSYETEYGIVEIHKSTIRYQMIKSHRILIDMTLAGKYVDDDKWHHVVLELSSNCRMITFKVDGFGKQALSRVVLPPLISANLKSIQIGLNGTQG